MKIGDIVTMRSGLIEGVRYGGIMYVDNMYFDGERSIINTSEQKNGWYVEGCPRLVYSKEMFSNINSKVTNVELLPHEIEIAALKEENALLRLELDNILNACVADE